jgi:AcrR family transcriptional regulator
MAAAADYFVAARDLMGDGDPRTVTLDALCKRLGTTSGSFYHHFGSLDGFVDALADDWSQRAMAAMHAAIADVDNLPRTRRLVNDKILLQQHQLEAAFRAWGRTNESMRRAVQHVDQARFEASRTMVAALNPQLSSADIEACAEICVLILIGAQAHDPATAPKVSAAALASFASLIERR